MSPGGYLAYVDGDHNLWVLDPEVAGEASEPREIADAEDYKAKTAYPPSFGYGHPPSEGEPCEAPECEASRRASPASPMLTEEEEEGPELILYQPGPSGAYAFNVETGELVWHDEYSHSRMDWDTLSMLNFWEPSGSHIYTYNRLSGERTLAGGTGGAAVLYVRSNQLAGEVTPPHEAIPLEELVVEYRPYLKYDAEEPYGAEPPYALTNVLGLNEESTEIAYTNQLKRDGHVLAVPPYEEWMAEAGISYEPNKEALFGLSLEALGANYPVEIPASESSAAEEDDYVDEHNDTHQVDSSSYYSPGFEFATARVRPAPDGLWLQYWLYYYYNNGVAGVDDHEGDWEMVQLHLPKANGYLLSEVIYAEHEYGSRCQPGEYETEGEAPGRGGDPVVYIANGDHASYPAEGAWEPAVFFAQDTVFPDLEARPSAQVYTESLEESSWMHWPGRWGGSGNRPRVPGR